MAGEIGEPLESVVKRVAMVVASFLVASTVMKRAVEAVEAETGSNA